MKGHEFLQLHPELRGFREHSQTWREVKNRFRLKDLDGELYIVRGDTLGDEDDLLVDALARGSSPHGPDPLARKLFEELSTELQQAVREDLLQ